MNETAESVLKMLRISTVWIKKNALQIGGGVILLSLASFILYDQFYSAPVKPSPYAESNFLLIKRVSPINAASEIPTKILIEFSEEVDKDLFAQYFFISPIMEGKFEYGRNKKIIEFIPVVPFEKDYYVSFTVKAGLSSIDGKTLFADYSSTFTTTVKPEEVTFMKGNISGRVLSFANNKPVSFKVAKTTTREIDVSIYRSNQVNLLNYLVYAYDKDKDGKNIDYSQKYLVDEIAHKPDDLLETRKMKSMSEMQTYDLDPGVYYLEAKSDDTVMGTSFLIVNSVGVVARQDDKKVTLTTYDLATNTQSAYPASIGFYNMVNGANQLVVHTYTGFERSFAFDLDRGLDLLVGTINNETVFVPFALPQSQADMRAINLDKTYKLFIYTDRPIYKPEDTVKFSGVLRVDGDSQYRLAPAGTPVRVSLGYDTDIETVVTTDSHGVFSGEFVLPEKAEGGYGLFSTTALNNSESGAYSSAYFEVARYTKPTFELTADVGKPEYLRNEKINFQMAGKLFNGEPLKDEQVTYRIYTQDYYEVEKAVYNKNFNVTEAGGMCGGGFAEEYYGEPLDGEKKVTLDAQGKFNIEFVPPSSITSSKKITLVVTKKDKSGNEIVAAANTILHGADYNVFFMPSAQNYKEKERVIAPFYVEDLMGDKIQNQEFTYKFVTISYKDNKPVETDLLTGKTKTDQEGKGIVSFHIPEKIKTDSKYLVIETTDKQGNKIEARKYIYITQPTEEDDFSFWDETGLDQTYLKIVSSKSNYVVGDKIVLNIRSQKEIDALVTLERGRIYEPQIIRLFPGENTVSFDVNTDLSPSVTVVFSFFADGKYHTEGIALNVPAMHKLLDVSVTTDKTRYKPDDTANLKVKTRDPNGNPVPASLTVSLVDKAIFSLRKSSTPLIHSALYYYRPRSTNASSSLTLVGKYDIGGKGGGGGGGADIGKVVDTLYWNPNLRTDTNGEAAVAIPLQGYETTWKASVIGTSDDTSVGQAEMDILVTSKEVQGAKTKMKMKH